MSEGVDTLKDFNQAEADIEVGLKEARENIKAWADDITGKERENLDRRDRLDKAQAAALISATNEINKETGKLQNPNVDSQKAAAALVLDRVDGYSETLKDYRDYQEDIQLLKNQQTSEHEHRGDLRVKLELLKVEIELRRLLDGNK